VITFVTKAFHSNCVPAEDLMTIQHPHCLVTASDVGDAYPVLSLRHC